MSVIRRDNTFYLKKRVPVRYAGIEPRKLVWISLKTDSEKEARTKVQAVWSEVIAGWDALLAGNSDDAEARYAGAKAIAAARGYRFLPVDRVISLPLDEVMDRIDASMTPAGRIDPALAGGLLGLTKKPEFTLSKALEAYWAVTGDKIAGKSADQVRRWRNPRIKAFNNLIDVIGDIPINQITADDMLDFRAWWWDKITAEDLTPNSANKDFIHIASTIREINQKKQLGLTLTFSGLTFAEGEKRTRLPFSEEWIRETLLATGALAGLNREARCLLLGMVNTGYRPSEGQGLLASHIRLDVDIPHISIEPVGRTLKNASSRRVIPLAGISLEAFRECPDGFPRYRGSAALSATVNKFLRENNLTETPDHTLYGLRHSFEDRLLDRDVDERIRRDLMGHALTRERYGKGASLEKLAGIIHLIAL